MRINRNDPYSGVVQYCSLLVLVTDCYLLSDSHRILETLPGAGQHRREHPLNFTMLQDQYGVHYQTTRERERERERDGENKGRRRKNEMVIHTATH